MRFCRSSNNLIRHCWFGHLPVAGQGLTTLWGLTRLIPERGYIGPKKRGLTITSRTRGMLFCLACLEALKVGTKKKNLLRSLGKELRK